jgi:uncharacterized protein (TIGR01777 family)
MHIVITGSSGFVGAALVDFLIGKKHDVTAVDMVTLPDDATDGRLRFVQADTTRPGDWQESIEQADAVINLTGKNIFHRWSAEYKDLIYDTRILTTRNIVNALSENRPQTLISTSAAGFYGDCDDEILEEDHGPGTDFLARGCVDGEKEAFSARNKSARVVLARFGVVLGPGGGALAKMIPAYRMFVGGPLGDGQQWFPWIQIEDLVDGIYFLLNNPDVSGPVNMCAPQPLRNEEFAKTLARTLNRPAFFRVPAFALRLAAGELGDLVLNSQRAVPARLTSAGFSFKYPKVSAALQASIG